MLLIQYVIAALEFLLLCFAAKGHQKGEFTPFCLWQDQVNLHPIPAPGSKSQLTVS